MSLKSRVSSRRVRNNAAVVKAKERFRLRLDLVITELDVGGAEAFCVELAKFLASRGHGVRVIAIGEPPKADRDRLLKDLQNANIACCFLGCNSLFVMPQAVKRLRALIKSDPPDLVQSILWHANVLSAYAIDTIATPLVGGVRVSDPRRWRFWLSRWSAKKMKRLVCVSRSTRDWCEKVEGIPADKLVVIPNGVDAKSMHHRAQESIRHIVFSQGLEYLLFVGRLHEQKGIDIILERSHRILDALPGMHLVLVGDGPWRARVEAFRTDSGYRDRIHVIGQSDQVPGWIQGCRLLLLPTRFEGMPNVLLEAMSCGKPVATMDVEGVAEVLGQNFREQTVSAGDWDGWEALVIELCQDTARAQRLGDVNKHRVVQEFDLLRQLECYEQLYQQIINS